MVAAEAHEIAHAVWALVRHPEAEEVGVEVSTRLDVRHVEPEVAKAPDLERLVEQHTADVELGRDLSSH